MTCWLKYFFATFRELLTSGSLEIKKCGHFLGAFLAQIRLTQEEITLPEWIVALFQWISMRDNLTISPCHIVVVVVVLFGMSAVLFLLDCVVTPHLKFQVTIFDLSQMLSSYTLWRYTRQIACNWAFELNRRQFRNYFYLSQLKHGMDIPQDALCPNNITSWYPARLHN